MPLTRKGTLVFTLFVILLLGGGAYYVYSQTGTFSFAGIWNRWVGGSADSGSGTMTAAETRAAILEAILKNPELRSQGLDVEVNDRTVTLKGNVETPLQRAALEQLAQALAGPRSVTVTVGVRSAAAVPSTAAADDIDARLPKEIEFALYKTDAFDVKTLRISSQNRVVRLAGSVRSPAEKLLAERIAREVPDVRGVTNDLEIVK